MSSPAAVLRFRRVRSSSTTASLLGYATLLAGSSVGRLISFATGILLARHLSPAAFGEFSIFFGVVLVLAEGTNFVDFTYVRYANTHPAERRSHLRAALVLKCVFLAGIAILALPAGWSLAQLFGKSSLAVMLALAVVTGGLLNVLSLQLADYLADERFLRLTVFNTIYSVLVLGVLALLVEWPVHLTRVAIGLSFVGPSAAVAAVCFARLVRASGRLRVEWVAIRRLLAFGKWLAAANVAYLVGQRLDLFVLSAFAGLGEVGNYGAALRVAVVASMMTGALPALLLPRASRTLGSPSATRSFVRHALLVSALIAAVAAILWAAAPFVVDTLLGSTYRPAIALTRIMLLGAVFAGFSTSLSQLFLADERPRRAFYLRLIKLVGILVFALPAVSRYGARGVAWSVVIAELLVMLYTFAEVMPSLRRRRVPSG